MKNNLKLNRKILLLISFFILFSSFYMNGVEAKTCSEYCDDLGPEYTGRGCSVDSNPCDDFDPRACSSSSKSCYYGCVEIGADDACSYVSPADTCYCYKEETCDNYCNCENDCYQPCSEACEELKRDKAGLTFNSNPCEPHPFSGLGECHFNCDDSPDKGHSSDPSRYCYCWDEKTCADEGECCVSDCDNSGDCWQIPRDYKCDTGWECSPGDCECVCTNGGSCTELGYDCDTGIDNCGDNIDCGECSVTTDTCINNMCVPEDCVDETTCEERGYDCGEWTDKCLVDRNDCPGCTGDQICEDNKCVDPPPPSDDGPCEDSKYCRCYENSGFQTEGECDTGALEAGYIRYKKANCDRTWRENSCDSDGITLTKWSCDGPNPGDRDSDKINCVDEYGSGSYCEEIPCRNGADVCGRCVPPPICNILEPVVLESIITVDYLTREKKEIEFYYGVESTEPTEGVKVEFSKATADENDPNVKMTISTDEKVNVGLYKITVRGIAKDPLLQREIYYTLKIV